MRQKADFPLKSTHFRSFVQEDEGVMRGAWVRIGRVLEVILMVLAGR